MPMTPPLVQLALDFPTVDEALRMAEIGVFNSWVTVAMNSERNSVSVAPVRAARARFLLTQLG